MQSYTIARKKAQNLPFAVLCVIVIILCMALFPPTSAVTISRPVSISANYIGTPPVAIFTPTAQSGVAPVTVIFTSQSRGTPPLTYAWDFGDNSGISSLQNPSHTYSASGTYTVNLTVTNTAGKNSAYGTISVNQPITLPTATLPTGVVGIAYIQLQPFTAAGGSGSYTYSVSAGTLLPDGLSLNAITGIISGTPTVARTFNFNIIATDTTGLTGMQSYTIIINPQPTITLSPTSLPAGVGSNPYIQPLPFTATGGSGSYTYSVTDGTLPTGLTLTGDTISGIPTVAATFVFNITATDNNNPFTGTQRYSITVTPPTITLFPTILPTGVWNNAYTETTITASGSTLSFTYGVTSGTLPTGLSLSSGGLISGTPRVAGDFGFTVTATDASGFTGMRDYTITIASPAITLLPADLPAGTLNVPYSQPESFTASGGSGSYTFSVTNGFLPPGLTLTGNTITGSPTAAGIFDFNITALDTINLFTGSQRYSINVMTTIILPSLPSATMGQFYSQDITPTGGTLPYTFTYSVTSGKLPDGLTLSANIISGTPTAVGTYSFTITVIETSTGSTGLRSYSFTVDPPIITLSPTILPAGEVGKAYSQTEAFAATGGTGPYTYSVTLGALPTGLKLTGDTISGTPTVAGTFDFNITATDANPDLFTGSRRYSITIIPQPITLTPASDIPAIVESTQYSLITTIKATGGAPPYIYSVKGDLPSGLVLDPALGIVSSGAPSAADIGKTFIFTIIATDKEKNSVSQTYTITVTAPSAPEIPGGDDSGPAAGQDAVAQSIESQSLESLGIDLSVNGVSIATGATVTVNGNVVTITTPTFTVVYVSGKITEIQGMLISQDAGSISLSTESVEASIPGVGEVSGSVEAGIDSISDGAEVNLTLAKPEVKDILAFEAAMKKEGKELDAVAFTMTVTKTNITANLPAKITMTVPPDWVARNGGITAVSIVRTADDGTTQVLPTTFAGIDFKTGNFVFEALSKDGLSVFGLVTAKATVVEKEENPNTTVVVASKSIVSTDVGMYAWMISELEQNPVILVILLAVVALVAYFGWWKRRL
jgi:PKD repeat protein